MEKITIAQMFSAFEKHNEENGIESQFSDTSRLVGVVVFKQSSWPGAPRQYTLNERSYRVTSDNKRFIGGMCGNSIFADCLDGRDLGVRLDWYLKDWKVDYCYLVGKEVNMLKK